MVISRRPARARELWSDEELTLIVTDYFDMFEEELAGRKYSKAAHWRALIPLLNGRNKQSIEFKHGNISAVLRDGDYPSIDGYKPYSNYQQRLVFEVERQLRLRTRFDALLLRAIQAPVEIPKVRNILSSLVRPPKPADTATRTYELSLHPLPKRDYAALEVTNRRLGQAGEEFVVDFERARLVAEKRPKLADRVEQVSASRGDGLGYDVLSFETSGRELLIEVKTTKFGIHRPFLISRHEVRFFDAHADQHALYRLFNAERKPRIYQLHGSISANARLDPMLYSARVR